MNEIKYTLVVAPRADKMLLEHTKFLAKVSIPAAKRLLADFEKSIERISTNPHMFPYLDENTVLGITPKTYRSCLLGTRYRIIFTVENQCIFIDAIADCRQGNSDILS